MTSRSCGWAYAVVFLIASTAGATSVPSLTFEELTDQSEIVATGQITRSWSDWDSEHKFIWTHYELSVTNAQKGKPEASVIISEPGGVVGSQAMNIAGVVGYQPGEMVLVFLQRMPNGYLRTAGWSQGKYTVDKSGRLHADAQPGLEVVNAQNGGAGTPLRSLDGMTVSALGARIAARVQLQRKAQ